MTYFDFKIDSEWHRVSAHTYSAHVGRLLKDYVDDTAREVERVAKSMAPYGPTGQLKAEGVVRTEGREASIFGDGGRAGEIVTDFPAFGGGFTTRGGNLANRGQFSGVDKWNAPGHVFIGGITRSFYEATVELNPMVPHSKWVHEGTGIYGPRATPIVPRSSPFLVFNIGTDKFVLKSVMGQKANPFLTRAFEYVSNTYSPAKLSQLRLEIAAVT
jgi:hypothetical protein